MTGPSLDLPPELVAPSYGADSIAAVLPAAAGALGIDVTTATGLRSTDCQAALGLPDARRVVVVLVDGLGLHNLTERGGHAPFLRGLLRDARSLVTSVPSTTAAALATFGTGTSPGLTGLLGYTQRNPATGGLATMVSWTEQSDPYRPGQKLSAPFGVDPADLQRQPTLLEQIGAATNVVAPGRAKFAGSGMTRAALRGPRHVTAEKSADAVDATLAALRGDGLVYLYLGDVDKVGHQHGPGSWQWGDALESVDFELRRLVASVPAGTLVLVTADHGMVSADPAARHDVAERPELSTDVALLGGEPRLTHVYAADGADVAALAARWSDALGQDAVVATADQAIDAGWLGPVADHVRPWVGDLLVAARGHATIVDSRLHPASARQMPGVHGSLTATEMIVPLLAATSR